MARIESDPNYTAPTFSRATAPTDPFKKEDVQNLAAAVSTHDHSTGKGVAIGAGSIPNGTITSAMLADGTIDTADLKDGAVTSAKIADGTIATADLAAGAVTNAKLAADTARANLLTNGGFEIWQRGTSFNITSAGGLPVTADMWRGQVAAGAGTLAISRDAATVSSRSVYSARLAYTAGAGDSTIGFHQQFGDMVDASWMRAALPLTLSFMVVANGVGRVRLFWYDGVASGRQYGSYNVNNGVWEPLSITFTPSAASSAAYYGVELLAGTSSVVFLDNAMLVVGSVPADYAPLHPADDLARCLRYYETFVGSSAQNMLGGFFAFGTTGATGTWHYKTQKAVTPTLTSTTASTFSLNTNGGTTANCNSMSFGSTSVWHTAIIAGVASGLTTNQASLLNVASGAGASITAEANP